jgi:hypothetical protein
LAAAASHPSQRHPGDGSRPSGNSSRPNVITGPMPAIHTQVDTQCTKTGAAGPSSSTQVIVSPPTV